RRIASKNLGRVFQRIMLVGSVASALCIVRVLCARSSWKKSTCSEVFKERISRIFEGSFGFSKKFDWQNNTSWWRTHN
ncbi:PIPO, partial [Narcissus degeneration virus]|uniref:PIPO n=1 Tax=Narcissus degeneration virus TaxID=394036 RepID=UPI0002651501